jgi:hypothetical protein
MSAECGRWVLTFGVDSVPGDVIRMSGGPERRIVDRDYPDVWIPVLRMVFSDGTESVPKLGKVEIWDPDGSVSRRVQDISAPPRS